jgi:hypothetical protein
MSRWLPVLASASLLAMVGAAQAQPKSLTDGQLDRVTAGSAGPVFASTSINNVKFQALSQVEDLLLKEAQIKVNSQVRGNSASLGFDNQAIGKNSAVQGTFSQETVAGVGSSQSGLFISAANGAMRPLK